MIVRVNVVLNRTVVVDSDGRFDNLCLTYVSSSQRIIPSTDVIQLTLTLKMTTAQAVETSVTINNNSPIQDYIHPDDQTQPFEDNMLKLTLLNLAIKILPAVNPTA